jgi:hypothetical protein
MRALRDAIAAAGRPMRAPELARRFRRARTDRVEELLGALTAIGQARRLPGERFLAQ